MGVLLRSKHRVVADRYDKGTSNSERRRLNTDSKQNQMTGGEKNG